MYRISFRKQFGRGFLIIIFYVIPGRLVLPRTKKIRDVCVYLIIEKMTRRDIYNKHDYIKVDKEKVFSKIQNKDNKQAVWEFLLDSMLKGTSDRRRYKLLCSFVTLEKRGIVTTPLKEFTVLEFSEAIATINNLTEYKTYYGRSKKFTESTKADYRRTLKQYFNYYKLHDPRFRDQNNLFELQRFYETVTKTKIGQQKAQLSKEDMYTVEDLTMFTNLTTNVNYKGLLIFLFYSGCRIEEALNIKLKDMDRTGAIWTIRVNGKTGPREIVVCEPIEALKNIIAALPQQTPDTYLFNKTYPRYPLVPMDYKYIQSLRSQLRGKIKRNFPEWNKPLMYHSFRRSFVTNYRGVLSDRVLRKMGGWTKNSTVMNIYDYSDADDIKQEFAAAKGLKIDHKDVLQSWTCPLCKHTNAPHVNTCKCGTAKDLEGYFKAKQQREEHTKMLDEFFNRMCTDDRLMREFMHWKRSIDVKQ